MKIRLYNRHPINTWHSYDLFGRKITVQYEFKYVEVDTDTLEVVSTGTEDFSPERRVKELFTYWIWTWDKIRRNRGGQRWFECHDLIFIRRSELKSVRLLYEKVYPDCLVQLRKY